MKFDYKIFLLALGVLTTGCTFVNENMRVPESLRYGYELTITITVDKSFTRGETDGTHTLGTGTTAENFINFTYGDYRLYVLDGENGNIIDEFDPQSVILTENGYELFGDFTLTSPYIQVMAIANWTTDFTTVPKLYPDLLNKEQPISLTDIYQNKQDYNFTYPVETNGGSDEVETWIPEFGVSGIPMVGLSPIIKIPEQEGGYNNFTPELEARTIQMLRSIAKIEVINATGNDELTIKSAKLKRYIKNGKFFPDGHEKDNENWYDENKQVKSVSYPESPVKATWLVFVPDREKDKTLSAYLPEMKHDDSEEEINYIEVVSQYKGKKEVTHKIPLGLYSTDGEYQEDTALDILRNHKYRFFITEVEDNSAKIIVRVNDNWEVIHDMELE